MAKSFVKAQHSSSAATFDEFFPIYFFQECKTATDVADIATKPVLTGEYKKEELLEASRSGNEEKLMSLLTPLNVNCHASDGRKSTPLHLAAGYNRTRIVQLLLQHGRLTIKH